LNKSKRPFVSVDDKDKTDKLQIVIQEILEDKIYLNMDGEVVENVSSVANDGGELTISPIE
jgi:hypothetical protein